MAFTVVSRMALTARAVCGQTSVTCHNPAHRLLDALTIEKLEVTCGSPRSVQITPHLRELFSTLVSFDTAAVA